MLVQNQSFMYKNHQANIVKNGADPKCDDIIEIIDHIIMGCPFLQKLQYIMC